MTEEAPEADKVDGGVAPESTDRIEDGKADLDADGLKAELTRARADAAKYRVDAQKWRSHEDQQKSETQKAQEKAAEAEAKLAAVELRATRAEVATKHQIPSDLVPLLAGSTKDEIDAAAVALKKHLKASGVPDLKPGTRGRSVGSSGNNVDDFIRGLQRR